MTKKSLKYQPTQVTLTRSQLDKLIKLAEHFKEVDMFVLEESHESGIGPTTRVRFNLFNTDLRQKDTTVDITDVESW